MGEAHGLHLLQRQRRRIPAVQHQRQAAADVAAQQLAGALARRYHIVRRHQQPQPRLVHRLVLEQLRKARQLIGPPEVGQQRQHNAPQVQLAVADTQQRVRRLIQKVEGYVCGQLRAAEHICQRVHALRFAGPSGNGAEPRHRLIQHRLSVPRRHHRAIAQAHDTVLALFHQRDGPGQGHGVVDESAVHLAALAAAAPQHCDQRRIPQRTAAGAQRIKGLVKGLLGFCLCGQSIQLLGQTHDAGDGADIRPLPTVGVAAAVPALHVLLAALPLHTPRDVVGVQRLSDAGAPLLRRQAALLQGRDELAAIGGVLAVYRRLLRRKITAPELIFRRDQRLAQLVIHTALVGQIAVSTVDLLGAAVRVSAVAIGAGLQKQNLRVGRYAHRLLPHGGSQSPERFVPRFVFLPLPVLFRHRCFSLL